MLSGPTDSTFAMPFASGERVGGRYQIDELIGTGGIGFVASAIHVELGERVAIKFLRPEYWNHEEALRRFASEARLAARVRSDFVVRVFDVGALENGVPYLVMELLNGRDLAQLLAERGPLDVQLAVTCVMQACAGLAAAHASQVIHRDVKPENLFLARQAFGGEAIKLLDFGIGKREHDAQNAALTTMAVGSPTYMSPEQIRAGGDIDLRTDVWSLGCVLYEILSGRRAFDAPSLMQVCAAVLETTPASPRLFNPAIPVELERVIMCCLAKNPAARFQDTASLALALAPFAPEPVRALARHCREIWDNARRPSGPSGAAPLLTGVVATPELAVGGQGARTTPLVPSISAQASKSVRAATLPAAARSGGNLSRSDIDVDEESPFARRGRAKFVWVGIGLALLATLGVSGAKVLESHGAGNGAAPASPGLPGKALVAHEPSAIASSTPSLDTASPLARSAELPQEPQRVPPALTGTTAFRPPQVMNVAPRAEHASSAAPSEHVTHPAAAASVDDQSSPGSGPKLAVSAPQAAAELGDVKTEARAAAQIPAPRSEASSAVAPRATTQAAGLTGRAIASVVRSHSAEVRACYERAQMDQANLSGKVTLNAVLDAGGGVTSSSAASSFAGGARLAACIAKAARQWKFPPTGGASSAVSYSFVFD